MVFSQWLYNHRILKRLAKALIRLRVCAGWSEALLVPHTLLLEISCTGSYVHFRSKYLMNHLICATAHSLMNYINSIDSCQAHLPVQYALNIELIRQKCILSYQGLRLSNLTLGLTALIFSDWVRHKPKIVTINMINHKAVQKSINTRPSDKTA